MKSFVLKICFFLMVFAVVFFICGNILAADDARSQVIGGMQTTRAEAGYAAAGVGSKNYLPVVITRIIEEILTFVGVAFLVLMIYAGMLWLASQGQEEKITKARKIMISAAIGVGVVMGAYAITALIGSEFERISGVEQQKTEEGQEQLEKVGEALKEAAQANPVP